jgi:hypothetical protein
MPSCPLCGQNTDVEPLEPPIAKKSYLCDTCNLAFEGSREEWDYGTIAGEQNINLRRCREHADGRVGLTPQERAHALEMLASLRAQLAQLAQLKTKGRPPERGRP